MADQTPRSLTDIEKEAANSYREWPIYIVMRLKRLQAIQEKLRVHGDSPSSMIRRDELLKAVYDQETPPQGPVDEATEGDDTVAAEVEAEPAPAKPAAKGKAGKAAASGAAKATAKASSEDDSDYLDDVNYD